MATDSENVRSLAHGIHQLNVNSPDADVVTRVKSSITELAGAASGGGVNLTEDPERPGIFLINGA